MQDKEALNNERYIARYLFTGSSEIEKKVKPLKIAIIWAQHEQKRAQCMHGPHAKRKTIFCAETINKSSFQKLFILQKCFVLTEL